MKNLAYFLSEEDKKKEKPHTTEKKDEGMDDKKFIALMGEYKQMRRNPDDRAAANKILKQAMKLGKEGDVSKKAKIAAAYL